MIQNIGIMFFSKVRFMAKKENNFDCAEVQPKAFSLEEGLGIFHGFQTNEAPVANMVSLLEQRNERLERLYCLVTPECISAQEARDYGCVGEGRDMGMIAHENGVETGYPSQFSFWCKRMREQCPAFTEIKIIPILLLHREEELVAYIEGQIASFTNHIKRDAGRADAWPQCHIYADITGGPRYVNMMMTAVLQFLQYDGMHIEKMLYADYDALSNENRIYDVRTVGDVYKLVAGADAFVSYGSSRAIEEYFAYDADLDISSKEIGDELRGVLRAMHKFSDAIQICQTSKIPDALITLNGALEKFERNMENSSRRADLVFMQLIDTIKAGYGALLHVPESRAQHYLAIICWCVDKGLLQQAMTLATEWMPVIMIDCRIVYPPQKYRVYAERSHSKTRPGWMQNFIIQPSEYQQSVYEERKREAHNVLKQAIENGRIQQDPPEILRVVQRVHQLFPRILRGANRVEALNKESEDIKEVYRLVCEQLNAGNRSPRWTIKNLLYDANVRNIICDQVCKKEGIFVRRLLYLKNTGNTAENSGNIMAKWAVRKEEWKQMLNEMKIVQTDCGEELMLKSIESHYILREQRNHINHATEENNKSRQEVIGLVNQCITAIQEASDAIGQRKG